LQEAVWAAGGKLVAVGDPKQLQPIDAGGIFGSLMRLHGKSEISNIQRQRTDFEPMLKWLDGKSRRGEGLSPGKAQALRELPEDARMAALEKLCEQDPKLAKAFGRWRNRFDFEWMREAVEAFATGSAKEALGLLEAKGRLKLVSGQKAACELLIAAWDKDKTAIEKKTIVAATRAEVAELNLMARAKMIERGAVLDGQGIEAEIIHRDDTRAEKRFAPGDRIVFTLNDRTLGVANGVSGTILSIEQRNGQRQLKVELDDANERDEKIVMVPASFGRFDHAYCLTNHKSQGRTFDSAYVLANPSMADREWTYVAASRSRFATTIFVNASALGLVDPESHRDEASTPKTRAAAIDALASRMRRSRAKGTSLDYDDAPDISREPMAEATLTAKPGGANLFES
jgi:ATP-dependent exoDNAse (exonuclease V) alpha subunit